MNLSKPYYLRTGRRYPVKGATRLKERKAEDPKTSMLIHGQRADSTYEVNTANALDYFKIAYNYHVTIDGGRNIRGGQILDFVIPMAPMPTVIDVQGDKWHDDPNQERIRTEQIIRHFKGSVRVVVFKDIHADTFDHAIQSVRREILL